MEFALVMPILLLLVFGIINFGVVFAQNLSVSNAARQAARFGAVEGRTCSAISSEAMTTVANEALAYSQLSAGAVTVTRGGSCAGATEACKDSGGSDSVQVTVTYTAEFVAPWIIPGIPSTKTLTGKGEFRCEWS